MREQAIRTLVTTLCLSSQQSFRHSVIMPLHWFNQLRWFEPSRWGLHRGLHWARPSRWASHFKPSQLRRYMAAFAMAFAGLILAVA